MSEYRKEHDLLGEREIPAEALHGIYTARAVENFPLAMRPVRAELIHAYGAVKLAAARTNHELGRWDEQTFAAIAAGAEVVSVTPHRMSLESIFMSAVADDRARTRRAGGEERA